MAFVFVAAFVVGVLIFKVDKISKIILKSVNLRVVGLFNYLLK